MSNGLPYYPRFPRDLFEGTAGMSITDKGPYSLILDLIYLHDGALPDNRQYIAGMLGMGVRGLNLVIPRLVDAGKLTITEGIISNPKASAVLGRVRPVRSEKRLISGSSQDHLGIISRSSQDDLEITQTLLNEINGASRARINQIQSHKEIDHGDDGPKAFREQLLEAMNVHASGMTGHGGTMIGTRADMQEVARWLGLPNLTGTDILDEVKMTMARKRDGPPSSFSYFRRAMMRLSQSLSQGPITQGVNDHDEGPRRPRGGRDAATLTRIVRSAVEDET